MIVDGHVHIFPHLTDFCGYCAKQDHMRFMQLYIAMHSEPARRLRDHAVVREAIGALIDEDFRGLESLDTSVGFRVGQFGRFEWEWHGETYYGQYFAPSLQEMISTPEFMLQQMGRAGVDRAILQNGPPYGRLNEYFSQAVQKFPDKFVGLAAIEESRAHYDSEMTKLREAITELGMNGLYYATRGLLKDDPPTPFDDAAFEGFWSEVHNLKIPVFWEIQGIPNPTQAAYLSEIDRLSEWCRKYSDVPAVLTHGVAPEFLTGNLAEPLSRLVQHEQLMVEVLYPIQWGRDHDYPYLELRPVLEKLYHLVGPARLVWGSDMPNVERHCTYRQSLEYLRHTMGSFASEDEMDAILGGNVSRIV